MKIIKGYIVITVICLIVAGLVARATYTVKEVMDKNKISYATGEGGGKYAK